MSKNPTSPQCQAPYWVLGPEVRKAQQSPQAADREGPPQAVLLRGQGCSPRERGPHLGRLSEADGVCPVLPDAGRPRGDAARSLRCTLAPAPDRPWSPGTKVGHTSPGGTITFPEEANFLRQTLGQEQTLETGGRAAMSSKRQQAGGGKRCRDVPNWKVPTWNSTWVQSRRQCP